MVLKENQQPNEEEDIDMEGNATIEANQTGNTDNTNSTNDTNNTNNTNSTEDINLEIDQLNDNSFMPVFTEMIKKLSEFQDKKQDNDMEIDNENKPMPSWMVGLRYAFNHYQTPQYDKAKYTRQVYIARLIVNYPQAFENYAHEWIVPLLKFVVKGHLFGETMNYLVHDICIILGVWGETTFNSKAEKAAPPEIKHKYRHRPPSDFQDAWSNCLNYLMQHIYHSNNAVVRGNISIVRILFQNWGTEDVIPTVSNCNSCLRDISNTQ